MNGDQSRDVPTPGERQGGQPLGDTEAREKGPWAGRADEGIAPAQPGRSDDESEPVEAGELGGSVVGVTTGSDEPATEGGVDLSRGDNADATTDGGVNTVPGIEPDLKDAASGPRQADLRSADDVHRRSSRRAP
jgi:hypothetical protein